MRVATPWHTLLGSCFSHTSVDEQRFGIPGDDQCGERGVAGHHCPKRDHDTGAYDTTGQDETEDGIADDTLRKYHIEPDSEKGEEADTFFAHGGCFAHKDKCIIPQLTQIVNTIVKYT